jgi:hypothetical protein
MIRCPQVFNSIVARISVYVIKQANRLVAVHYPYNTMYFILFVLYANSPVATFVGASRKIPCFSRFGVYLPKKLSVPVLKQSVGFFAA